MCRYICWYMCWYVCHPILYSVRILSKCLNQPGAGVLMADKALKEVQGLAVQSSSSVSLLKSMKIIIKCFIESDQGERGRRDKGWFHRDQGGKLAIWKRWKSKTIDEKNPSWGRSPQICTVYLCVTLKNKIINPCSKANSLITRLVYVPTTTKTILGHLPDLF